MGSLFKSTQSPIPSVMPMSAPVSVYGTFGLLQSSLGKDMADAAITTSSGIQDGTKQMVLGSWTDRDISCVS